jgi:hypothetical protein
MPHRSVPTHAVPQPTSIYAELAEREAEILHEWLALIEEEPWVELPSDDRFDHLPSVVTQLLAAMSQPDAATIGCLVAAACQHGADRRAQGVTDRLLFIEYLHLRAALWRVLRAAMPEEPSVAAQAMLAIDVGIGAASRASLLGFHQQEIVATGVWPRPLEQVRADLEVLAPVLREAAPAR